MNDKGYGDPKCKCGATSYYGHLKRVAEGYPPHVAFYVYDAPETWDQ